MHNPFEYGRELKPHELVDRQEEVRAVVETIRNRGKLFLIGPRRYGKTSILEVAAQQATTQFDAIVLRYDAEAYPTLEQLAQRMVADASKQLIGFVERAGEKAARLFGRLRPQVSVDMTHGTFTATFNVAGPPTPDQVPLITEALNGIDRLAEETGRTVAVIIDEFQQIVEAGGRTAEGQLRSVMQRHAHVGYVIAGSKTRLLAAMTSDPSRPFYNMGQRWFLGPIPRPDFTKSLTRGLETAGSVDPKAIDRILDAAEDVPYNVQMLAHECWDWLYRQPERSNRLTVARVDAATERVVRRLDGVYTQWWVQLTSKQQTALVAFLTEQESGLALAEIARRYGLPLTTLQRALEALREKGLLRDEEVQGNVRLRLLDPFFGAWIMLLTAKR
ncbi:MAG TPA: ATP-binding protein [Gemmatimonadaceae bacterium]|nr:ATP-binding protein [Gemmatimonadaceae bacterium]